MRQKAQAEAAAASGSFDFVFWSATGFCEPCLIATPLSEPKHGKEVNRTREQKDSYANR
jgi:hypothetical protein